MQVLPVQIEDLDLHTFNLGKLCFNWRKMLVFWVFVLTCALILHYLLKKAFSFDFGQMLIKDEY